MLWSSLKSCNASSALKWLSFPNTLYLPIACIVCTLISLSHTPNKPLESCVFMFIKKRTAQQWEWWSRKWYLLFIVGQHKSLARTLVNASSIIHCSTLIDFPEFTTTTSSLCPPTDNVRCFYSDWRKRSNDDGMCITIHHHLLDNNQLIRLIAWRQGSLEVFYCTDNKIVIECQSPPLFSLFNPSRSQLY